MRHTPCLEVSRLHYYLAIIVLIITAISSIASLGYTLRRIDEIDSRVTRIEHEGSVPAQLTYKDVQWIIENMKTLNIKVDRVERKLDRHMEDK